MLELVARWQWRLGPAEIPSQQAIGHATGAAGAGFQASTPAHVPWSYLYALSVLVLVHTSVYQHTGQNLIDSGLISDPQLSSAICPFSFSPLLTFRLPSSPRSRPLAPCHPLSRLTTHATLAIARPLSRPVRHDHIVVDESCSAADTRGTTLAPSLRRRV